MSKKYYEKAAQLNNTKGIFLLGTLYHHGKGVQQDFSIARKYYELAASMKDSNAYLNLGNLYSEGLGVKKDFNKMMECYEKSYKLGNSIGAYFIGLSYLHINDTKNSEKYLILAANADYCKAQLALGQFYDEGKNGKPNYEMARHYYELAADHKDCIALNLLGMLYYKGKGVEQDTNKAIEYLKLSAEQNDSTALFNLGLIYIEGKGIKKDSTKALYYYEQSAKNGNPNAIFVLAVIYYDGRFIERDFKKALQYAELAAKLNVSDAYIFLGNLYCIGDTIKPDYSKSISYYEKAIKLGNSNGYCRLAFLYSEGKGVDQDYKKAKELYEMAEKSDNLDAITSLGNLYYEGKGVKKDYSKARKYYEQAVKHNDQNALLNLASIYFNGDGVPCDYLKAMYYYELCEKQNNFFAAVNLGFIYLEGHGVDKDISKAMEYFEIAEKRNNVLANFILGAIYYEGINVEKDYAKAINYFTKASYQKHSYSLYFLGLIYLKQGELSKQNYIKAREYFDLSAKQNNSCAFFYLGYMYENGKGVDKNISKAIKYYTEGSSRKYFNDKTFIYENNNFYYSSFLLETKINNYNYYRSNNDLGLIYITELEYQNMELAEKYLKEAGLNEYPFGQNNYGLFCQYYLNKKDNAKHMYERASEHNFALSHFNLGHFYEEEGNLDDAFKHYILVSQCEKNVYKFRDQIIIDDERLNVSKTFLACFTNLKLTQFYLNEEVTQFNDEIAKDYLMKAIFHPLIKLLINPSCNSYLFQFKYSNQNFESKLMNLFDFFLNFPLFNIKQQSNNDDSLTEWKPIEISSDEIKSITITFSEKQRNDELFDNQNKINKKYFDEYKKMHFNSNSEELSLKYNDESQNDQFQKEIEQIILEMNNDQMKLELESSFDDNSNMRSITIKRKDDGIERIFKYQNNMHEFIFKNVNKFKNDIDSILLELNSVIYQPPYNILFGRIRLTSSDKKSDEINQSFYNGFLNNNDTSCNLC